MEFPTITCARAVRDGGIDAIAALNEALRDAIVDVSPQDQEAIKRAFGDVMGAVFESLLNPAVRAFPELNPDESTWVAVAKARAAARAVSGRADR